MKEFNMKHKIFLSILPFFVVIALIGSGFALFVFDDLEVKSDNNNISINVENAYELGNIYLTSSIAEFASSSDTSIPNNIEKDDTSLKTTLFFDYNSLYFIRSDNITKERTFNIYYYNTIEEDETFSYSKVQLNLEIAVTSSESNVTTVASGYKYSTSALDYLDLASSKAGSAETTSSSDSLSYDMVTGEATTSSTKKTVTYALKTGLTSGDNYSINLDLAYASDLAPSATNNKDYFSEVISYMKTAITSSDTKIALTFYLSYNE